MADVPLGHGKRDSHPKSFTTRIYHRCCLFSRFTFHLRTFTVLIQLIIIVSIQLRRDVTRARREREKLCSFKDIFGKITSFGVINAK